jgi:spore maturation protein CgeB
VVLNDHWREMADDGFLSNRLFDAVASGARVVSDEAAGLTDVFGDAVVTYSSPDQLGQLLNEPLESVFADRSRRIDNAARIAAEHSFDARAAELIEAAQRIRGSK